MFLSIITINRNNAEGLKKTLESVASQTCRDFEHIIIDGASTDGGRDLFDKYGLYDENLKIIGDHIFFYLTMVKNHVPYTKINEIISLYDTNGISSTAQKESLSEYESYLKKEFSPDFYQLLKENFLLKHKLNTIETSLAYKLCFTLLAPIKFIEKKLQKNNQASFYENFI